MWYTCNWISVEDFVEQFMTTVFCVFANCNVDGVTWWTLTSWIDFELANYWNSADICFGSMQFGCFSRNISIFSCVCVCIVDLIWRKVCKYTDNQLVIPHNLPFFFSMCWPDSEFVSITLSQSAASLGQSLIISIIIWDHQSIRMIITASIDCLLAWLNQRHTHTHTIKANFRAHQIDFLLCLCLRCGILTQSTQMYRWFASLANAFFWQLPEYYLVWFHPFNFG